MLASVLILVLVTVLVLVLVLVFVLALVVAVLVRAPVPTLVLLFGTSGSPEFRTCARFRFACNQNTRVTWTMTLIPGSSSKWRIELTCPNSSALLTSTSANHGLANTAGIARPSQQSIIPFLLDLISRQYEEDDIY